MYSLRYKASPSPAGQDKRTSAQQASFMICEPMTSVRTLMGWGLWHICADPGVKSELEDQGAYMARSDIIYKVYITLHAPEFTS